jgi:hypothetical protein
MEACPTKARQYRKAKQAKLGVSLDHQQPYSHRDHIKVHPRQEQTPQDNSVTDSMTSNKNSSANKTNQTRGVIICV